MQHTLGREARVQSRLCSVAQMASLHKELGLYGTQCGTLELCIAWSFFGMLVICSSTQNFVCLMSLWHLKSLLGPCVLGQYKLSSGRLELFQQVDLISLIRSQTLQLCLSFCSLKSGQAPCSLSLGQRTDWCPLWLLKHSDIKGEGSEASLLPLITCVSPLPAPKLWPLRTNTPLSSGTEGMQYHMKEFWISFSLGFSSLSLQQSHSLHVLIQKSVYLPAPERV